MQRELKVNSVQGRVLILDLATAETIQDLKAMLVHPFEDLIERKIFKSDDDQTLAGFLEPGCQ